MRGARQKLEKRDLEWPGKLKHQACRPSHAQSSAAATTARSHISVRLQAGQILKGTEVVGAEPQSQPVHVVPQLSAFQSAKWDVETSPRGSPLNLSMTSSQGGGPSIETDSLEEKSSAVSAEGISVAVTEKPPRPGRSRFSSNPDSREEERVEQVSKGVYLTLRTNSQGEMELKRVRFR